jgi:hypothetical protein
MRAGLVVLVACSLAGCGRDRASKSASRTTDPAASAVVFDTGSGTGQYDQMTYAKYQSEMAITPEVDIPVRSIRPRLWYCNGSCGYLAFIRSENYEFIASQAGMMDGDMAIQTDFAERLLDPPMTLRAGKTYRIVMETWTTKSIGIYTTGARTTGAVGAARYTVLNAHSDTADHLDRGAVAFQLLK